MRSIHFDTRREKILYYGPSDYTDVNLSEFIVAEEKALLNIYNVLATNDFSDLWFDKLCGVDIDGKPLSREISRLELFKFAQTINKYPIATSFLENISLGNLGAAVHLLGKLVINIYIRKTKQIECLISLADAQAAIDSALAKVKYEYATEWRNTNKGWNSTEDIEPFGYGRSSYLEKVPKFHIERYNFFDKDFIRVMPNQ